MRSSPGWILGALLRCPVVIAASVIGCSVRADSESAERLTRTECSSDTECGTGRCLTSFGICSQNQGDLRRLLFEIIPPASDPVYGGARFLTVADLSTTAATDGPERGISAGWFELNVRPRVPVSGSVSAAPDQAACLSRARSTLPVTLTFTPRERLLGLPVPSYELVTRFDEPSGEYTFQGLVPPGHYDVYMRPNTSALSESCVAIPQIFRDRSIGERFQLEQPPPAQLQLTLPWRDELEGWLLDMVHPVTGEVISNRVRLSAAIRPPDVEPDKLRTTLYYSRTESDFGPAQEDEGTAGAEGARDATVVPTGDELVRLTPPPGSSPAGTVLLQRSGIELATPGEGQIGDVFSFGAPVDFRAWVWKEGDYDAPVPGTVSFAARDLDAVADGVPTAFDRTATVDARGEIRLQLLPGRYRVRVTPPGTEVGNLGILAGSESTVTVWPSESGAGLVQGGYVIEVPPSVSLNGSLVTDVGGQALVGVEVRVNASSTSPAACRSPSDDPASCTQPGTAVLRNALAQDPFVPRTRSALSETTGDFRVAGLDCGQCEPGAGARFDLSVRPPPELGLPWLIRRGYNLYSNESMLVPLRVPPPVAHAVRLTYGDPTGLSSGGSGVVPGLAGALVRVYALLDHNSLIVNDPEPLEPCVTLPPGSNRRCLQSVLQVAELRSGTNGEFLLLLPPSIQ